MAAIAPDVRVNGPLRDRADYLAALGIERFVLRGRESAAPAATATQAPMTALPVTQSPETATPPETQKPRQPRDGDAWGPLEAEVAACTRCALHRGRTQTVFGVGRRNADLLVIGEAPGADEDRQGEPFVGRAGQLLNAMLRAIGLPRDEVYIANILKCRPPNNRDPGAEETAACTPYLDRQIALLRPRAALAVGRIAAQHLLQSDEPIGRLRGRVLRFGPEQIPIVVTYHPAYLLRSPLAKAKAWSDLCLLRRLLKQDS